MFKINPRTKQIELTRGDKASIEIKIPIIVVADWEYSASVIHIQLQSPMM